MQYNQFFSSLCKWKQTFDVIERNIIESINDVISLLSLIQLFLNCFLAYFFVCCIFFELCNVDFKHLFWEYYSCLLVHVFMKRFDPNHGGVATCHANSVDTITAIKLFEI